MSCRIFKTSLGHKHVTRFLVWQEYIAKHPVGYRKSQFFYHLKQHLATSTPTTVLSDTYISGEKLYVDFAGDTLENVNTETGEMIKFQVFVACLPWIMPFRFVFPLNGWRTFYMPFPSAW